MGKLVTFCNAKTVFITRGRQRLSVCQGKTLTITTGNNITDISQEILEEHYKVIKKQLIYYKITILFSQKVSK